MNPPVASSAKGHPWFAASYDFITQSGERSLLAKIRPHIAGEAEGRVLEIGAGTGANFPYYRPGRLRELIATEPDPYMLRRARRRAKGLRLAIEFSTAPAEELPFAEASFDTVVATLVFCTVDDPARALSEVRRVLKPSGTFRFIEHIQSEAGFRRQVQGFLNPAWRRLSAGCNLTRQTDDSILAAGFEIIELQRRETPLMPIISGIARLPLIAGETSR